MSSFPAILGNKKPSEYKDVLVKANVDYLGVNAITLQDGEELNFTFGITDFSSQRYLAGLNNVSQYIVLQTNGNVQFQLDGVFGIVIANQMQIGVNTFKFRRVGLTHYCSLNGGAENSYLANSGFSFEEIGRRGGVYSDIDIYNFSVNGEQFKPDGNGLTYTGSNGTIVTRNTSHADQLDYINSTMVQAIYGSNLDYKDVLVEANQDYLELDNPIILQNDTITSFRVYAPSLTKRIYLFTDTTLSTDYFRIDTNGTVLLANDTFFGVTTNTCIIGWNDITLRYTTANDVFISINGSEELVGNTILRPEALNIGKRFAAEYVNFEVSEFTINGEQFKPDGNGLTYTGSNGTIVTRNTSHSDQINYVNLTMINKI